MKQEPSAKAVELQEEAWRLQSTAQLDDAFVAAEEALRLLTDCEGVDSPDVANLLNDLADIERERENFRNALALAERARGIADGLGARFGGEAAARIRGKSLELLGTMRCALGEYALAESDLKSGVALAVAEFGEGSAETVGALNNLGMLYKYWGRFAEGLALYEQALFSVRKVHGEDSLAGGVIYHNIGGILHAQGEFSAAESPARRAWEISRAGLGEDDRQTLCDAVAYAAVLDGLERYGESEVIYRRALSVFETTLGSRHYEVAACVHNLAATVCARGEVLEAEGMYRRALSIKEEILGANSPDAALTRNNLGALLTRLGRLAEAVELLESSVATLEERQHAQVKRARENLKAARAGRRE